MSSTQGGNYTGIQHSLLRDISGVLSSCYWPVSAGYCLLISPTAHLIFLSLLSPRVLREWTWDIKIYKMLVRLLSNCRHETESELLSISANLTYYILPMSYAFLFYKLLFTSLFVCHEFKTLRSIFKLLPDSLSS